jgi:hypothetical protein
MRDLIESTLRCSWAMSLLGVQQLENVTEDCAHRTHKTRDAFDPITRAATEKLGRTIQSVFKVGDQWQRGIVDRLFDAMPPGQSRPATDVRPVHSGRLNTRTFVVLGEGLAAGMGDFTLSDRTQVDSLPAQMARQMGVSFCQRLIQAPGICNPVGFAELPVILPIPLQTTVLDQLPPVPVNNFSVPNYRLTDSLNLRPTQPLIDRHDAKQTAANLILGVIPIAYGEGAPFPTQVECAVNRQPTFTLVELGYHEALEAAVKGDPALLPGVDCFQSDYQKLLEALSGTGSEVLMLNIPDPIDTAYFSNLNRAGKILKLDPAFLIQTYNLNPDNLITVHGLNEIGFQLLDKAIDVLPGNCMLSCEVAEQIRGNIRELNDALASLARQTGALLFDLHGFFRKVNNNGIAIGSRRLTAEYLGGFYTLNGYYPGATGHALIANEILHQLNQHYGSDFPQINIQAVMNSDPVAAYRQAEGPDWTTSQLSQIQRSVPESGSVNETAVASDETTDPWNELEPAQETFTELRLPPGLEQVLPISKAASYFGDGITPLNCREPKDIQTGSCGHVLFGGLAMVDSHLSGRLRIKFTPPENNLTRFEVSFLEGFTGDDSVLVTPQFFKMPFKQSRVDDVPGQVSAGVLNLATGEVSNLTIYAGFSGTALLTLVSLNPSFPRQPLSFPGPYGSAWAKFQQRANGLLDFTFYGSTYVPLGNNIRWPLTFSSPAQQFATIPANGSVLHPHLQLSTKEPEVSVLDECPDVPFNTVQELTLFTHNSSFGDAFTLNSPQLGGGATGRSHVLGRAMLQFGARCGNSVPVAISLLTPGGLMAPMPASPIVEGFPGRLYPGPHGCNEFLRFPLRTYSLDDVVCIDDPFDISVGAVDLRTGRFLNELLHRGFINQDLIFALIRIEPRTPRSSFFFRGPAALERGSDGQLIFRFEGTVHIPYPQGFLFPSPNLTTAIVIGPNSALDPFLWIHAIQDTSTKEALKSGSARHVVGSNGEQFSYSYEIPPDPAYHKAMFEYENHSQQGKFELHSMAWVGFSNSEGSNKEGFDTVTFACFGVWSKDGVRTVQQATVQISTSPQRPYVGIQVGSGTVSNVNTKPPNIEDARP